MQLTIVPSMNKVRSHVSCIHGVHVHAGTFHTAHAYMNVITLSSAYSPTLDSATSDLHSHRLVSRRLLKHYVHAHDTVQVMLMTCLVKNYWKDRRIVHDVVCPI